MFEFCGEIRLILFPDVKGSVKYVGKIHLPSELLDVYIITICFIYEKKNNVYLGKCSFNICICRKGYCEIIPDSFFFFFSFLY